VSARHGTAPYVRWVAFVTVAFYTAGYSAIGFAFLFFGALGRLLTRRPPLWRPTSLDVPLAVFGGVLIVSALLSPYRPLAVGITLMVIISGAVYFGSFAWLLDHAPESRAPLLRIWAAGAPPAALVGLVTGAITHQRASIPHGVGPNGLGTTLLLGSVLALGLALRAEGRERLTWLGCSFVSLIGLLATASRTSLVGWAVGAAYLVWRALRAQPARMTAVLAAGLVVLVIAGALSPQLAARVPNTISDISENRLRIWPASLGMIKAHPLWGTGFGTFATAYERVKSPEASPEPFAFDMALNIAVETGLVGLFAAVGVAAVGVREWLRQGHRSPPDADPMRPVVAALWIGLLVDQLADNTLFSISTSAALWLLLALLVIPPPPVRPPSAVGQIEPREAWMVR
jgi:O-antigen ligase